MPLSANFNASGPPKFKPKDITDPLTRHMMNPRINETESQRIVREREEKSACQRSKEIDEWIAKEKMQTDRERKKKNSSKIILLGQSQSGKSTTLKNFQLYFSPSAFQAERGRWKTVIHLNLVRSVRKMHDALTSYAALQSSSSFDQSMAGTSSSQKMLQTASPTMKFGHRPHQPSFDIYSAPESDDEDGAESDASLSVARLRRPKLSSQHRLILLRLRPILSLEKQLLRQLHPEALPGANIEGGTPWMFEVYEDSTGMGYGTSSPGGSRSPLRTFSGLSLADEVAVPASWGSSTLKMAATNEELDGVPIRGAAGLSRIPSTSQFEIGPRPSSSTRPVMIPTNSNGRGSSSHSSVLPRNGSNRILNHNRNSEYEGADRPLSEAEANPSSLRRHLASPTPSGTDADEVPERILVACAPDIVALWRDQTLRNLLCGPLSTGGLGLKLHEDAGFFLDDVKRITASSYVPSDDDILRARLKTMGISEHRFTIENKVDIDYVSELIVYDVGGARTQRHKWMQFFEDVNVVVFLAPISAFDQRLAEDPSVNRLQDTFCLWKEICQTKSLAKTDFLLFMNKCDLLKAKLSRGLVLKKFIPQFQGGNNVNDAIQYFRQVFMQIWKKNTAEIKVNGQRSTRTIFIHHTSMIDSAASRTLIQNVQDLALRSHLRTAMVI